MPDPLPRPPGRPPGEPIIIKNPPRPSEVVEIDGSLDEDDDPEIKKSPDIIPEKPPPPAPWDRADHPSDSHSCSAVPCRFVGLVTQRPQGYAPAAPHGFA